MIDVEAITITREEYDKLIFDDMIEVTNAFGNNVVMYRKEVESVLRHYVEVLEENNTIRGKLEYVKTQVEKIQDELVRRYIG